MRGLELAQHKMKEFERIVVPLLVSEYKKEFWTNSFTFLKLEEEREQFDVLTRDQENERQHLLRWFIETALEAGKDYLNF